MYLPSFRCDTARLARPVPPAPASPAAPVSGRPGSSPLRLRMNFRTRSVSAAALALSVRQSPCSCYDGGHYVSTLDSNASSSQAVSNTVFEPSSAYFARHSGMLYSRLGIADESQHRRRRIADVVEGIGVVLQMESVVRSPGNEHELAIRLPVEVVVVAVAGIPVPVPHQHLSRPERQEPLEVYPAGQAPRFRPRPTGLASAATTASTSNQSSSSSLVFFSIGSAMRRCKIADRSPRTGCPRRYRSAAPGRASFSSSEVYEQPHAPCRSP